MTDFLTLYHDEIVWLAVLVVCIVIGILTDAGQFTKHRSIRRKVRLIALPVICAIVAFVLADSPYFWDNLFFYSLSIWFLLFFPRWYKWGLFKHDDDDKNK